MRQWMRRSLVAGALLALGLAGTMAVPAAAAGYPNPGSVSGDVSVHDPSMVRAANGTYYLFSTHQGIEIRTSTDRIHFTRDGSVFPSGVSWASAYGTITDPWAPDVSFHNGSYWLYYAVSSFGSKPFGDRPGHELHGRSRQLARPGPGLRLPGHGQLQRDRPGAAG